MLAINNCYLVLESSSTLIDGKRYVHAVYSGKWEGYGERRVLIT